VRRPAATYASTRGFAGWGEIVVYTSVRNAPEIPPGDGDHAVEDVVTRRVDDPHSSGPEAIENLVPANATAARQLHDGRCVDGSAGWDASTTDKIEPVTVPQK